MNGHSGEMDMAINTQSAFDSSPQNNAANHMPLMQAISTAEEMKIDNILRQIEESK